MMTTAHPEAAITAPIRSEDTAVLNTFAESADHVWAWTTRIMGATCFTGADEKLFALIHRSAEAERAHGRVHKQLRLLLGEVAVSARAKAPDALKVREGDAKLFGEKNFAGPYNLAWVESHERVVGKLLVYHKKKPQTGEAAKRFNEIKAAAETQAAEAQRHIESLGADKVGEEFDKLRLACGLLRIELRDTPATSLSALLAKTALVSGFRVAEECDDPETRDMWSIERAILGVIQDKLLCEAAEVLNAASSDQPSVRANENSKRAH